MLHSKFFIAGIFFIGATQAFASCEKAVSYANFLKTTDLHEAKISKKNAEIEKLKKLLSSVQSQNNVLKAENSKLKTQMVSRSSILKEVEKNKKNISKKIKTVKKNTPKEKINKKMSGLFRVATKETGAYFSNTPNGKLAFMLKRGDIVSVEHCNQWGWCKGKDKELYYKQMKIKRIEK